MFSMLLSTSSDCRFPREENLISAILPRHPFAIALSVAERGYRPSLPCFTRFTRSQTMASSLQATVGGGAFDLDSLENPLRMSPGSDVLS